MPTRRSLALGAWTHSQLRLIASVVVGVMMLGSLVAFAMLSRGTPAHRVDLNDAGVWVTNNAGGLFGRLNKSAASLDAFFNPTGGAQAAYSLDIVQDAGTVLGWDQAGGKLSPVNVATARLVDDGAVPLSSAMVLDMRGGTIAVLDPTSGKVWGARYTDSPAPPVLSTLASTTQPIAEIGAQPKNQTLKEGANFASLAVDSTGAVHAATITGKSVRIPVVDGQFGKPLTAELPQRESIELTAVGTHVAILDVIAGTLGIDGQNPTKRAELTVGARLQAPGPDAPEVLVATPKSLVGFSVSTPEATARVISSAGSGLPAAPVRVRDCSYAAWPGSPGMAIKACGQDQATPLSIRNAGAVLAKPVFRVNRGQVLLNDVADGQVLDLDTLQRVDNWENIKDPAADASAVDKQLVTQEKEKPKANADTLGARPGRTTMLYVLDNDTDKGGRILSVASVTQPGNANAKVSIAPDGQALIYTLSDQGGDSEFTYQLSNGVAEEKGQVRVVDRGTLNDPPVRKVGSVDPRLTVASGGVLPIQVLDQWRDPDGDPVGLAAAAPSAGTTNLTSDGRIELTAPATASATSVRVAYDVSDGRSAPVKQEVAVSVLGSGDIKSSPVVTQPDVGRGEVGRQITLAPLLNDIPGADPLNPKAVMKLAAGVAPKEGLTVETDLVSGRVAVTGSKPGHYFLDYSAAFGSSAVAQGALRVDIDPAQEDNRSPVAVPDKAVVRGAGSILVDVLSNDSDPLGSVLTVEGAAAAKPAELQAAVVNGRWVKLTPTTGAISENPTFVTYRVSNGVSPATEGVVSVTQLAAASPDTVLARADYATVRAGDATTIRVLENDAALSGANLTLLGNIADAKAPGQLKVYNAGATDATAGDLGAAYVSGDAVRYLAPSGLTQATKVMVEYVAVTESGDRGSGLIEVTLTPEPTATQSNQAPTPRPIEVRAVSGETVTIPVDPHNNDPDGDSTAVVGITGAPTLGRILGFSPTGITYQAYPDASTQGTDVFTYAVTDRFGATATSTIRVGVTPPAAPQVAVAAPMSITATPGAKVTLYPLPLASFVKTDPVRVLPWDRSAKDLPAGVALDEATQSIVAVAGSASDRPVQFTYRLTGNAGKSSFATVTVYSVEGYKNPPRLQDTTVKPDGSGKAVADVLAKAYDPDGDSGKLRVTKVGHPLATVNGGKITVPVTSNVRVIPFEVTDESGATSAAVIHVPAEGAGGPYLRAGKVIKVDEGASVTVKVSDYIEDPQGKAVRLTLTDLITAGPSSKVTASAPSGTELTVTGAAGYIGPGAVVAEFTNGATIDDPLGIKTFVSIPIQVGPETPVLRCPADVIPVVRGGEEVSRDITSMCSVWSPTKEMSDALRFEGTWTTKLDGVSISNGRALTIDASNNSTPGATGVISVTAAGTKATPSPLNVVVLEAPRATLSAIVLPEMKAGERREIDLTDYFDSKLKEPQPHAVSITKNAGMDAQQTVEGMRASITPAAMSFGRMEFRVVLNDVIEKDDIDRARRVTGTISFDVFTRPAVPGQPQPQTALMSRSAQLSWAVPASNGAPILDYEVSWAGGTQPCPSTPCTITGLENGRDYSFKVRARNKAGWSDPSSASLPTRPNAQPLAVVATQTAADDKSVTLVWPSAQGEGSAITDYIVAFNGQTRPMGAGLGGTFAVPTNGTAYTFTIVAKNNSTTGPSSTVTGYAAGTPSIDGAVVPTQAAPADSATTTVTITVNGANQNGPQPVVYTVTRDGIALPACKGITSKVCVDQGVTNGKTYTYAATVSTTFLGVTRTSAPKSAAPFTPYGVPAQWTQPVVARASNLSNGVVLNYTVPASRGKTSVVSANLGSGWVSVPSPGPEGGAATSPALAGIQGGGQVTMRVCNEGGKCTQSGAVPYNAYADTTTPVFINGSVSGQVVCVGVRAAASGWTATLTLNGPAGGQSTSGSGALQIGQVCATVGWSTTANFSATITDSAHPNGEPSRSQKTMTWSASTGPEPVPEIWVTHGTTSGGCANCKNTYLELRKFRPNTRVHCFVKASVTNLISWEVYWTVDGNGNHPASDQGNQGTLWSANSSGGIPDGVHFIPDLCNYG